MKKKTKIILSSAVAFVLLVTAVPTAIFFGRGNISSEALPDGFSQSLKADAFQKETDVRIMSSNLLVHYKSWGGTPAKPRSKQYTEVVNEYKPDVIGIQEMCDSWYCLLQNNLPDGYKLLFPFSSGVFVRMTAMAYNSDTLDLIDSGNFAYENGDNPRLRRVVWGVFEVKETGKRFAVVSTHFDLLRDGREEELTQVMRSQKDELLSEIDRLSAEYNCPVFSTGDFNTMEDTPETREIDIPEIYNSLAQNLTDTKFNCNNRVFGEAQAWEYPSYDHIFIKGNAETETFALLSYGYLSDMSDHYPIFADININE